MWLTTVVCVGCVSVAKPHHPERVKMVTMPSSFANPLQQGSSLPSPFRKWQWTLLNPATYSAWKPFYFNHVQLYHTLSPGHCCTQHGSLSCC